MTTVVDSLPLYERKRDEERAPLNRKWHCLQIAGLEINGSTATIIPAKNTGITKEQLHMRVSAEDMNNIPMSIAMHGGWVIFNGSRAGEFHTDGHFRNRFRLVTGGTPVTVSNKLKAYKIVSVDNTTLDNEITIVCEDATWNLPTQAVGNKKNLLKPGNWLIMDRRWFYAVWTEKTYNENEAEVKSKANDRKVIHREMNNYRAFHTVLNIMDRNNKTELHQTLLSVIQELHPDFVWERREKNKEDTTYGKDSVELTPIIADGPDLEFISHLANLGHLPKLDDVEDGSIESVIQQEGLSSLDEIVDDLDREELDREIYDGLAEEAIEYIDDNPLSQGAQELQEKLDDEDTDMFSNAVQANVYQSPEEIRQQQIAVARLMPDESDEDEMSEEYVASNSHDFDPN